MEFSHICSTIYFILVWLLVIQTASIHATSDLSGKNSETKERSGRAWHYPNPAPQTLQQHQQNQPPVFLQTSTNKPGESAAVNDPNNGPRNFEEQDKSAVPAASEQDFLSRYYGYLNVHRFDPNFPYYDRQPYPRYPNPSPHSPRFGPGYRKDKYGHGYGYSCKQGDDCDEVRAANQIPPVPPPHIPHPHGPHGPHLHHNMPPTPYNSPYVDVPSLSSIPSYPSHSSFPPYPPGGIYPPARFSDPHIFLPHQIPQRFYHGRYLHDQENSKNEDTTKEEAIEQKTE